MKYVTETKHVPLGFGEIAGGALDGQAVTLKGAVHSLRAMGGITFLALRVRDGAAGEERELDVDALFVAVGQEPRNRALTDLLLLDEGGYVMAGEDCKASLPGVFAAGDCTGGPLQVAKAVGEGHTAGLSAAEYVDRKRNEHQ